MRKQGEGLGFYLKDKTQKRHASIDMSVPIMYNGCRILYAGQLLKPNYILINTVKHAGT